MSYASIYVPNFAVQAVVRAEPGLCDCAVALLEGVPPLCKVVAANEAALRAGITLGMPEAQATQFAAPQAGARQSGTRQAGAPQSSTPRAGAAKAAAVEPGSIAVKAGAVNVGEVSAGKVNVGEAGVVEIRRRSPLLEKSAQAALLDVGWSVSPRIENTAPGAIVMDLAGMATLFQSVKNLAAGLQERTASVGLHAHIAVASNIETAIHAARGFPGITLIPAGDEAARLGVLPVTVLRPAMEILETLDRWGIRTCGALAALPVLQLSERLGQEGVRLHELACGTRRRSLMLAEPETCFAEALALEYAVTELEPLAFLLGRLLDQICARLQARSLAAASFCLRFDLQDAIEHDPEAPVKKSSAMTGLKSYEKVLSLPAPMRNSKMLLQLLRLQLQSDPPRGSIVSIFLSAEPARPRAAQAGLFVPDAPDPEKLEVTMARLANLVGSSNVGSPELVDTHRPGEFRMCKFRPAEETAPRKRELRLKAPAPGTAPGKGASGIAPGKDAPAPGKGAYDNPPETNAAPPKLRGASIAFRMFRPEPPLNVESREGCPCRIYLRGRGGNIVSASGPWRTSGDWWQENGWQQDEWDVEIRFDAVRNGNKASPQQDGLYRIYYDGVRRGWFARGRYD